MAISTPTIAVENASTLNAVTYDTTTFNPIANALLVVTAEVSDADDPGTMTISDDFDDANTWAELSDQPYNIIATPNGRVKCWWTIVGPAPGTGKAITVSGMEDACTGANIIVVSIASGYDTTTPIVQTQIEVSDSGVATATQTFDAYDGESNLALAFANMATATAGPTVDAPWTELGTAIAYSAPIRRAHVAYLENATDTTAVWSWTTNGRYVLTGVEIKASGIAVVKKRLLLLGVGR